MRELLDFLSQGCVIGIADAGRTIGFGACDGDQDVLFRPIALAVFFAQFSEVDLELRSAVAERGPLIAQLRLGFPSQLDEVFSRAGEVVAKRFKSQPAEKSLHLRHMLRIVGADEQVDIGPAFFHRRHVEP
ncbi:hypothetical protein PY365_00115 [Roseiarcaceae bacterium H3SJ34-1]|nr:hypothetical protein [Roseiarcaceae bacterium H3SJ34-1]